MDFSTQVSVQCFIEVKQESSKEGRDIWIKFKHLVEMGISLNTHILTLSNELLFFFFFDYAMLSNLFSI